MKVAVMTDENSGMLREDIDKLGIFMMPMPFFVNGELMYQTETFTHAQFYDELAKGAEVSTSQPSPGDVIDMWNSILGKGYDEIVYIPMTSGLSASCQSAKIFAEDFDGKVQVVDNHRISVTMEQSVMNAIEYVKEGMSAAEVKERLEKEAYDASIYITVENLEYLKRGGRVTAAGAAIGTILSIKPVLTIQGVKLDAFSKERGMKKARHCMVEAIKNDIDTRFKDLRDADKLRLCISYSYVDDATLDSWCQEVNEALPGYDLLIRPLSLSIGCHIGPGALAIAVCRK